MTALASTDLTVTVNYNRRGGPGTRRNIVKIAFGDGTLTYPSGGVALPSYGSFGLVMVLRSLNLHEDDSATGIFWKFDYTNQKLRGYIQGATISAAGAATLDDFPLNTTADALASSMSLGLDNAQSAGTVYLGTLKELSTAAAPPATSLYGEAVGW